MGHTVSDPNQPKLWVRVEILTGDGVGNDVEVESVCLFAAKTMLILKR